MNITLRDLALFHPIFLHFPIALTIIALLCDLFAWINLGKRSGAIAVWMLVFAAITAMPTLLTGLAASHFARQDLFLYTHRLLAFIFAGLLLVVATFRSFGAIKEIQFPFWLNFTASLILACLVGVTADFGGVVSWGRTPFQERNINEELNLTPAQELE